MSEILRHRTITSATYLELSSRVAGLERLGWIKVGGPQASCPPGTQARYWNQAMYRAERTSVSAPSFAAAFTAEPELVAAHR